MSGVFPPGSRPGVWQTLGDLLRRVAGLEATSPGPIDSTENVGLPWGVQSLEPGSAPEADGLVLSSDGAGGSTWSPLPSANAPLAGIIGNLPDLAGFWKLNEPAGSTSAADSSGNGFTLTAGAGTPPTFGAAAGPPGETTADFTGAKYLTNASVPTLGSGSPFSALGFVYYTDSDPADSYTIIGQGATAGDFGGDGWQLAVVGGSGLNPHKLLLYVGTGSGAPESIYSNSALAQNTWYFVAITYDGTTWRMYVNGVLQSGTSTRHNTGRSAIYLGAASAGDATFHLDGRESYMAITSGTLTVSDLLAIYNASTGPSSAASYVLQSDGVGGTFWAPIANGNVASGAAIDPTKLNVNGVATNFLDGTGAFDTVKDSDLSTSNITTNDVSSAKHGFAPKGDGDTTKFLNANGAYSIPAGGTPSGSAGGALDGSYPNPGLAASVAGAGLAETSDVLSVNVDGSTLEINADTLRVKAGGIGANELASTAVTPTTYGDSTHVAQFTVDADGRITAAAPVAIAGAGGGGSFVASDAIWDTKGDIALATGADAAAVLAVGSNGQMVTAASAESTGAKWTYPPGYELFYTEFTSNVTVSASSEGSPNDVVSSGAQTYAAIRIRIDFYAPAPSAGSTSATILNLWDDTTDLGRIGVINNPGGGGTMALPIFATRFLTPTAATHTYKVRAWRTTANGSIDVGAGGAGVRMPGFIRVSIA